LITGTVVAVSSDEELARLIGRRADPRLLGEDDALLPQEVGRPAVLPPDPAHDRIVAVGVTMTAASLIGGIALMLFGVVGVLAGADSAALVALVLGALLAGTHWGWVHVAEITANRSSNQRNAELIDGRQHWLDQIEPYTRWRVTTDVHDDGAIEILRIAYRPIPLGEDRFSFAREVQAREVHSGDEPGAAVTERAELMRREAAADTGREAERYRVAAEAYHDALLRADDEDQQRAAVRAASQALSEAINENLREPPLSE
jgi:hypothetical protein